MFLTPSSSTPTRLAAMVMTGALALLAVPAAGQSQPGRLLFSPRADVIVGCNSDGSNCFSVVGGDPTRSVSGARDSSIAATGTIAFEATWGPDGTCVVGAQGICQLHIFLMDGNGDHVRQLTFNPSSPQDASAFGGDRNASVSSDGTMVAFVSNRNPVYDSHTVPHYIDQIYVVNTDGSGMRQITTTAFDGSGDPQGGGMRSVAWSPDGTKLAFSGNLYTSACGTFFGSPINVGYVGVLSLDGSSAPTNKACLGDNGGAVALDWSADGTLIAYGLDGNIANPAIGFFDLSGQDRLSAGMSVSDLGTRCTSEPHHCFHFSPDSTRLVYENQTANAISTIGLDGTGRADFANVWSSIPNRGIWWAVGAAIPFPAQLTLGPNPTEVWPGFAQQLVPSLLDPGGNAIFHAASAYSVAVDYGTSGCIDVGPFGLALYAGSGNGRGTIAATNAGATSNSVAFKCWASPPCTYQLAASSETFSGGGGSDSVGVLVDAGTSGSGCPWSATSNAAWITISSGSTGSGNASVSFTVAPNPGAARQSTLTIAGATFTVNQDQAGPPQLQSITVLPATASVAAGLAQSFTATGHYSDGSTEDVTTHVTWSSSNTSIATISNSAGTQGHATGVATGGPITITADMANVSGTAALTVTPPVLVSLAVSPASPSVPVGGTQQFTATGTYSDGSVQTITGSATWSSSNVSVATITTGGLASAVAGGTTTISAQVGSVSNSTTMAVVTLQSLAIAPLGPSVVAGTTIQFAATGRYSDGSTRNLTAAAVWTSSKTSVATVASTGLATARAKGSTTIKAVAGGFAASTTLTVVVPKLQSIAVTPATATVSVRGTQQFTAIGTYDNGTTADVTSTVTWSSSSKMVASVSSSGLATGLKAGVVTIGAKSGAIGGSATLTVH